MDCCDPLLMLSNITHSAAVGKEGEQLLWIAPSTSLPRFSQRRRCAALIPSQVFVAEFHNTKAQRGFIGPIFRSAWPAFRTKNRSATLLHRSGKGQRRPTPSWKSCTRLSLTLSPTRRSDGASVTGTHGMKRSSSHCDDCC